MSSSSSPSQGGQISETPAGTPKLSSQGLLQGLRRIVIDHEGTEYTLHLTRQNKLLLTK